MDTGGSKTKWPSETSLIDITRPSTTIRAIGIAAVKHNLKRAMPATTRPLMSAIMGRSGYSLDVMKMIQIVKWDETFECAESRKVKSMKWIGCPTGVSSAGYCELMSHGTAGVLAFAVFQSMCQMTATLPYCQRGTMSRPDGTAMNTRQLAHQLRIDSEIVKQSIALLASDEVMWIEVTEAAVCQKYQLGEISQSAGEPGRNLPVIHKHREISPTDAQTVGDSSGNFLAYNCIDTDIDIDKSIARPPACEGTDDPNREAIPILPGKPIPWGLTAEDLARGDMLRVEACFLARWNATPGAAPVSGVRMASEAIGRFRERVHEPGWINDAETAMARMPLPFFRGKLMALGKLLEPQAALMIGNGSKYDWNADDDAAKKAKLRKKPTTLNSTTDPANYSAPGF
jgi:hypothetical protein